MTISLGTAITAFGVTISLYAGKALADWQLVTNGQPQVNYPDWAVQTQYDALSQIESIAKNAKNNLLLDQLSLNDQSNVLQPTMIVAPVMQNTASNQMNPQETIEFQLSMFTLHNKLRANAGLSPLEWSPELAAFASASMSATEQATQSCPVKGSSQTLRKIVGQFTNVGENLFVQNLYNVPTAEDVISSWYNQGVCYQYNTFGNACATAAFSPQTPECNYQQDAAAAIATQFTQIMWSTTTHVGCAIHKCSNTCSTNSCPQYVVGCNYGSTIVPYGGNVPGLVPFDSSVAKHLNIPQCNEQQQPQNQFLVYHVIKTKFQNSQTTAQQVADALAQSQVNAAAAQNIAVNQAIAGVNQIAGNAHNYYNKAALNTAVHQILNSQNAAAEYAYNVVPANGGNAAVIMPQSTSPVFQSLLKSKYILPNQFPGMTKKSYFRSQQIANNGQYDNTNLFSTYPQLYYGAPVVA